MTRSESAKIVPPNFSRFRKYSDLKKFKSSKLCIDGACLKRELMFSLLTTTTSFVHSHMLLTISGTTANPQQHESLIIQSVTQHNYSIHGSSSRSILLLL